jgi:hypothetical protein
MPRATCETRGHLWGRVARCVMCGTPRPAPAVEPRPSHEWWARFVSARHGLILMWLIEGRTPPEIAATLSMDADEVVRVGATPYQDHTGGELPFTRIAE